MSIYHYIRQLESLETIYRAPGTFSYFKHSVSSHNFKVAEIAQLLGDIEENNGSVINWKALYNKSINHDVPEVFISDIKAPIKHYNAEINQMINTIETNLRDDFIKNEIPSELQEQFKDHLSNGKDSTLEGKILSAADKIDQVFEAFGEIEKGNPSKSFLTIYRDGLREVNNFKDLPSVKYFIDVVFKEMVGEQNTEREQLKKIYEKVTSKEKVKS